MGGAFDGFEGLHRAQFFAEDEKGRTLIELAARGAGHQEAESSAQASLFGGMEEMEMPEPAIPCASRGPDGPLGTERDVIGVYISGHPLDKFRFEIKHLCSPDEGPRCSTSRRKAWTRIAVCRPRGRSAARISKAGRSGV